jgi:inner membrane protein
VRRIDGIANDSFPGYRTLDHVLTPTPTDPLCWDVLVLGTQGDRYAIRHAVLSIAPRLVSASRCPTLFPERPVTAPPDSRTGGSTPRAPAGLSLPPAPPRSAVSVPDSASVLWLGQYSMSIAQLVQLVEAHCEAAALMQFARAPFAFQHSNTWFLGDLRFDRGAGFRIQVGGDSGGCSIRVPWVPPRMDLLRPD